MMDFITVPLTFGIVTWSIYKLFELFVCKKERMTILEKMDFDNPNNQSVKNLLKEYNTSLPFSFSALKIGCLLMGLGLGLILGIWLFAMNVETVQSFREMTSYNVYSFITLIIGASVLFTGGAGLLLAFIIEYKCNKRKN